MGKIYKRKNGTSYTILQIGLKVHERNKLRVLCAELGLSMQEFIKRLIRSKFPDILAPQKQPRTFKQLVGEELEQEDEKVA